MSYCVNCGVELAESEKYCPLCQTEVINPGKPWKEPREQPYPQVLDAFLRQTDKRYMASLITVFLLIPALVTLVCDLLDGRLSWSVYPIGALLLLFFWVPFPLFFKRYHRLSFLATDCLAAILYLWAIAFTTGQDWFIPLGLPISAAVTVLLLLLTYCFRKGRGRQLLTRISLALTAVGILTVIIEITVDLYAQGAVFMNWSFFALIPCVVLAIATQIIDRQKKLKQEIQKRLFY